VEPRTLCSFKPVDWSTRSPRVSPTSSLGDSLVFLASCCAADGGVNDTVPTQVAHGATALLSPTCSFLAPSSLPSSTFCCACPAAAGTAAAPAAAAVASAAAVARGAAAVARGAAADCRHTRRRHSHASYSGPCPHRLPLPRVKPLECTETRPCLSLAGRPECPSGSAFYRDAIMVREGDRVARP
jgi:hypothetical protein